MTEILPTVGQQESVKLVQSDKVRRYHCTSCGADLAFDPKDGVLACSYCGHQDQIPTSIETVQELSYEQYLSSGQERLTQLMENALQVECKRCGSVVVFKPPEMATLCSFCGASIIAQPQTADPMVCPEAVLPFSVEKKAATAAFSTWLASRWFAPDALKQLAVRGALSGVYLPFWTYDTYTMSYYTGMRGEWYYETETYVENDENGNPVTKSREVRRTMWYPAAGRVERWFDDLLVAATKSLPERCLKELEPWDLPELKSYDPAFLAGFKAQRYQVGLKDAFDEAKEQTKGVIAADVSADIGGDEQQIISIKTQYSAITFKHILMPVYIGAYTFNEKVYQVLINGRTGEVQGERPYSWIKITLLIVVIAIICWLLITLISNQQ